MKAGGGWHASNAARLWHATTILLFLVLLATGAILHFAVPSLGRAGYTLVVRLHDIAGIAFSAVLVIYLVFVFASGYRVHYLPRWHGLGDRVRAQARWYLAGGSGSPPAAGEAAASRFNALQQLTYFLVVFLLLPLLVVSGLLYFLEVWGAGAADPALRAWRLGWLARIHEVSAFAGAAYLLVHAYMALGTATGRARLGFMFGGRAPAGTSGPPHDSERREKSP